jgi:hypothetical protein
VQEVRDAADLPAPGREHGLREQIGQPRDHRPRQPRIRRGDGHHLAGVAAITTREMLVNLVRKLDPLVKYGSALIHAAQRRNASSTHPACDLKEPATNGGFHS